MFTDSMKTIDVYMREVEIIKKYINTRIILNLKSGHYNDNIYEYSQHLQVIKEYVVRNLSGRLFQYFEAATVKAASAYIEETHGTESFISSHLRLGRVVSRIRTPFDKYSGTSSGAPIYIAL